MCQDIRQNKRDDFQLLVQEAKCELCTKKCPLSIANAGLVAATLLNNKIPTPATVALADNHVLRP